MPCVGLVTIWATPRRNPSTNDWTSPHRRRPSSASWGGWNAAKEAAGLETNSSRGSRVAEKPDDVAIQDEERWAELTQDQRWHYKNVEHNTQRSLDRRQRLRAFVYLLKREAGGCEQCGESDPACLDFHHRSEADKEMSVSKLISYGYARDRLLEEIARCKILCANCHRKEHYSKPRGVENVDRKDVRAAIDRIRQDDRGSSQH